MIKEPEIFYSEFGHVRYWLVTNVEQLRQYEGLELAEWIETNQARTHILEDDTTCIVCLNLVCRNDVEALGMLAHESVHIKQVIMNRMGEDSPGIEHEAYCLQRVFQNLLDSYWGGINYPNKKEPLGWI